MAYQSYWEDNGEVTRAPYDGIADALHEFVDAKVEEAFDKAEVALDKHIKLAEKLAIENASVDFKIGHGNTLLLEISSEFEGAKQEIDLFDRVRVWTFEPVYGELLKKKLRELADCIVLDEEQ